MKTLITLLGGILFPILLSAQWQIQDPGFTAPREICYVHALDDNNVWVIAIDASGLGLPLAEFSRTNDGGSTWIPGAITTEEVQPSMIFALSDQKAFVPVYKGSGWSGQAGMFRTDDGGTTWTRQTDIFTDPTAFPDIVHFFDANNGVAVGDPVDEYFDIYFTGNGGATWTRVPSYDIPVPLPEEYATVMNYSASGNSIWVPTTKGRMLFSSNGGMTWNISNTPYPVMYNSFIDENHGVILDHQSWDYTSLNETFDGGYTWSPITSTGPILNWDIEYVPGTVATFVTSGAVVNNGFSFSVNAGHDWHWAPESQGTKFFYTDWVDNNTGWAGGFNEGTQRAVMYKYAGPGLTDLIFSSMSLGFGEVDQGETASQTVTISNYGENVIDLFAIYTDNMDFYSNTPSAILDPGESVNVEVIFQPSYVGLDEGHLIVQSDHPDLPHIEILLTGIGVDIPDILSDPAEFGLNMFSGKKQFHDLTLTNSLTNAIQYSMSVSLESTLPVLGWNYNSTPLNGWSGILDAAPDQAMFIKEFTAPESINPATLYLGFDDGCRVWINGQLACDFKYNSWSVEYWNEVVDVSSYIQAGVNRISVVVFNGVYNGGGGGGFDCQLTIAGVDVIKRGDENNGQPEAMWYYYGQTGMMLMPPEDINQREWWEMDYGSYDWLKLSRATDQQFVGLGWNHQSTPCPEWLLNAAPDMAQFVKDIEVPEFTTATLYLGYDDACRVWINGEMKYDYHFDDHGLNYWDAVENISGMLIPGRNRIAVEVYNGIWYGGGGGNFDCQLTVDGVDLIKRGDQNPGDPEAMWYMFGQGGQQLIPPDDFSINHWFTKDYAYIDQLPSNTLSGTIPVGASENIKVIFDATGLPQGTYFTNVNINYDLMEMLTQVPVTLIVTDGPHCELQPRTLDYGDVYYSYPETMKITVSNTGTETLDVIGIFCDNMYCISADPSYFSLEPAESTEVNITYTNNSDDKYIHHNLYLESNDPFNQYTVINLMAYGKDAPDLVIENVSYMFASLPPDGFESQNLHLENWGNEASILNLTLPQSDSKNVGNKTAAPVSLPAFEKLAPLTTAQRTLPSYYKKDIKAHKDLVIKTNDPPKSGVASDIEIFSDDMENGPGNWTTVNYMETELQWHLHNQHYYSEVTSWWCGNETTGDYQNGSAVREAILSPSILLPPVECVITLEFHEMWEVEGGYDQCYVDISTDGGYNWDRIREGIPGSSEGWKTTSLDISNYWNQTVKVRFFFDTGDEVANYFPGWFIDDVRIYVEEFNFLSVSPGTGSIIGGQAFDVTVDFDASGYDPGYYPGFILIMSNDPEQPQYYLPANMEVVGGSFRVSINVLLEGAYSNGTPAMTTGLNNILPLEQPYNTAPWNYYGGESVPEIPTPDIVDWVLVELRDSPDAASATPATIISQHAAFLRNDGQIVGMDGFTELTFYSTVNEQLYCVVWHRNHLGVLSAYPMEFSEGSYHYYFSTDEDKAYGGSSGHKMLGDGVWGMYAGDGNADNNVETTDKTIIWYNQASQAGYYSGDYNLNGQVNNPDKNNYWLPNESKSCQVPQ